MANAKKPVGSTSSELRAFLGLTPFGLRQFHQFARWLAELAMQTDKGVVLATALVQELRREKVVLPPINVIERICALAITRANRKICLTLAETLNNGNHVYAGGTFAATYRRIDFQHAGLVATNARCAKRQASIGTPSTTKDNRGARSTQRACSFKSIRADG